MASPPARRAAAPPGPPAFADRAQAGVLLGAALLEILGEGGPDDSERMRVLPVSPLPGEHGVSQPRVVFALPRGGVPVGAGVARALGATLDALMVRKIGHPAAPELGLGAIAEDGLGGAGEPYFDEDMLAAVGLTAADLAAVVARERAELARRVAVYGRRPPGAGQGGRAVPGAGGAADAADAAGAGGIADAGGSPGQDLAGMLVIVVDDGLATGVTARAALRAARARGAARTVLAVPVAAPAAAQALKKETDEVVTLVTPRRFRSVGEWYADFGQLTDADVLTILSSGDTARRAPA